MSTECIQNCVVIDFCYVMDYYTYVSGTTHFSSCNILMRHNSRFVQGCYTIETSKLEMKMWSGNPGST